MKTIATIATILLFAVAVTAADVVMDAAIVDRDGAALNDPHVRLTADNSTGLQDLTNVRFKIEIHSGVLGNAYLVTWDDPANPWYGARAKQQWAVTQDYIEYRIGRVYYPDNVYNRDLDRAGCWAPAFSCEYLPENPNYQTPPDGLSEMDLEMWHWEHNHFELFDTVPVGLNWDMVLRLEGWLGQDIEIFSVAEGEMKTDQQNWTLTDPDTSPQTVPEPATVAMLIVGGAGIILKRRSAG